MRISREQVEHVAHLARLGLTESEKERFSEQLSTILESMEILRQVDTKAIPPTAQVIPLLNVMRDDEACPSLPREQILANAPRLEEDYIRIMAVLEE
ncbi:MAG: Asp-tRNA(Asn)/Glu-tRNA(Gln) amidotransferase subunit GatC [Chloroflexi bacterium]|nr:Asp-tRNA(Asn)/Glu-tRNA(Gln) amidotransferase subunit GatC [Chloroflexota bacterium]MCL5075081.1 Asp-tRNA(Asn)/Glu-tRNA(Gln) amidotransferase subunit GatC [Chloroflexota bacterium]